VLVGIEKTAAVVGEFEFDYDLMFMDKWTASNIVNVNFGLTRESVPG
jgi:hypothetical protein